MFEINNNNIRAKSIDVILVTLFLNFERLMFFIVDFDHDFAFLLSASQHDQFFFSINEFKHVYPSRHLPARS